MNRKIGKIERWKKSFGFIFVTHKERYFLPISEFDVARDPIIGEMVEFDVSPAPENIVPTNKQLPVARNCKPVEEKKDDNTGAL